MVSNLKHKQISHFEIDYKKEVTDELDNGREINALFLIHGYIEAYLLEWLYICTGKEKIAITKEILKQIDRIPFANILTIHLMLSNIDYVLFKKIQTLNGVRNDIAHELITIDSKDPKNKKKVSAVVKNAITICDEVFRLYKESLDRLQKKVLALEKYKDGFE